MNYTENYINSHWYLTFYFDKLPLGKIIFDKYPSHLYLVYVYIEKQFRGKNYLKYMLDILDNLYYTDLVLEAKEDNVRYNKLINHYIKHGFEIIGKSRYEYQGDNLFRKLTMKKKFIQQFNITGN